MKFTRVRIVLQLAVLGLCACSTPTGSGSTPLRVGMTPDLAPIVFKQSGAWHGLEVDLAKKLAGELGRPLQIVELAWDDQIPALMDGRTDIIMSGMTITDARKVRIEFSSPIMESGLMALIRAKDKNRLKTPADLAQSSGKIGVMPGTTGEAFVKRQYNAVRAIRLAQPEDVAFLMQRRTIEAFVHDAPSVLWQYSRDEGTLAFIPQPLNREKIGWGLRRGDQALMDEVNAAITSWQADGTLVAEINKWVPFYAQFLEAPSAVP